MRERECAREKAQREPVEDKEASLEVLIDVGSSEQGETREPYWYVSREVLTMQRVVVCRQVLTGIGGAANSPSVGRSIWQWGESSAVRSRNFMKSGGVGC